LAPRIKPHVALEKKEVKLNYNKNATLETRWNINEMPCKGRFDSSTIIFIFLNMKSI
jgi:hypothetical protein